MNRCSDRLIQTYTSLHLSEVDRPLRRGSHCYERSLEYEEFGDDSSLRQLKMTPIHKMIIESEQKRVNHLVHNTDNTIPKVKAPPPHVKSLRPLIVLIPKHPTIIKHISCSRICRKFSPICHPTKRLIITPHKITPRNVTSLEKSAFCCFVRRFLLNNKKLKATKELRITEKINAR